MARPTRLYFLLACWGAKFRDYICRFMLPSLLAPGNIPALRHPQDARFLMVTTREDWLALEREPAFRRLREAIRVEAVWDEGIAPDVHKYQRMSNAHAALASRCFADRAIAINLNPDTIFPDGCVAEAQRLCLDEGKDVVLCAAIRFDQVGILAELEAQGRLDPGRDLAVTMREAVALGLRNLHPEARAAVWTAPNFGRLHPAHQRNHFLTCCIWPVPGRDEAFVVTHNWSPFAVNYGVLGAHDPSALDGRALDGDYIFENFPRYTDQLHVVTDSDSLFLLGMTPRSEMAPPDERAWFAGRGVLAEWTRGLILSRTVHDASIDAHRRELYRRLVHWHAGEAGPGSAETEREARRLVATYVASDVESPAAGVPAMHRLWNALVRPSLQ